jgi:hypothetical protein
VVDRASDVSFTSPAHVPLSSPSRGKTGTGGGHDLLTFILKIPRPSDAL